MRVGPNAIENRVTVEHAINQTVSVNPSWVPQVKFYSNALQDASLKGDRGVVELLLERGADVNAQGGEYGNALQAASVWGDREVVELLLDKGADVNAQGG